jgi:hypothetical protein
MGIPRHGRVDLIRRCRGGIDLDPDMIEDGLQVSLQLRPRLLWYVDVSGVVDQLEEVEMGTFVQKS